MLKNLFSNEVTYTVDEFLDKDLKRLREIEVRNDKIKELVVPVATATGMAITAFIVIGGKEVVVPVILSRATKEVAVCSLTQLAPSGLELFNDVVMEALNKLFAVTCLGGLVIESIQTGSWSDRSKFSSALTKYSLTYAGGLFVLYTLAQIKTL